MKRRGRSAIDLYPFQIEGVQWLTTKRHGLLADHMGLGKTLQVIASLDDLFSVRNLILCPGNVRIQWLRQFQNCSSFARNYAVWTQSADLSLSDTVICSYDLLENNAVISLLKSMRWESLVCDESHFLKSLDANRTRNILAADGIIHCAERAWFLSGTPAPNHAGELWALLYTCGVTRLGYEAFVDRYCTGHQSPYGYRITGTNAAGYAELRDLLKGFMLRRKLQDVAIQLPSLTFENLFVEAGPVDFEVHYPNYFLPTDRMPALKAELDKQEATVAQTFDLVKGHDDKNGILESLAESTSSWRRFVGLQKANSIADVLESELAADKKLKITVFAIHQGVIEQMRVRLRKFHPVTLYGGTPMDKRTGNIRKFRTQDSCRVFIGNIQAMVGVDGLQDVCHEGVFAEQDWVPGNNAQAAMRLHRIGQTLPVRIRIAMLADSIDEQIQRALRRKVTQLCNFLD